MSHRKPQYEDVRKLIYFQAKRFWLRFGGEFEEIVGQALLIYIEASLKFKFRYGNKFSSYIANRIWHGLIDYHKKLWKRPQPLLEDMITQKIISIPSYSDRAIRFKVELYDSITKDAKNVVDVLMKHDWKLKCTLLRQRGARIERRALRKYLTKHKGWSDSRVDNAFWSLQKAIRD